MDVPQGGHAAPRRARARPRGESHRGDRGRLVTEDVPRKRGPVPSPKRARRRLGRGGAKPYRESKKSQSAERSGAAARRRRTGAARRTRATARRRTGPRRSTTSLGDLRGRAAAPRRPAEHRQFDTQHRRRYRASRVLEPRPAPPPRAAARERRDARAGPRRRAAEGRAPVEASGRSSPAAPPRAHHAFAEHREALRRYGDGREQPQERARDPGASRRWWRARKSNSRRRRNEDADSDDEEARGRSGRMRDAGAPPPAPRPKRRRKTKAAPVEPVLSEYELGRARQDQAEQQVPRVGRALVPALTQRLAETSTLGRWRRHDHDAAVIAVVVIVGASTRLMSLRCDDNSRRRRRGRRAPLVVHDGALRRSRPLRFPSPFSSSSPADIRDMTESRTDN